MQSVAVLSSMMLLGCGGVYTDYGDLDFMEISGTVKFNGEAVAGAVVVFEAADKSFSSGVTDDTGYYELMFNSERSGVLEGHKIVRIGTTLGAADVEAAEEGTDPGETATSNPVIERIPPCYNTESKLHVRVTQSTTMNFDLKLDCSTQGPT